MKIFAVVLALFPLISHANTNHSDEDVKYCEDGITLDKAYEFYVYQEKCDHEAGLVAVRHKQSKKEGYVNYEGKLVIPTQFDDVYGFSEGLSLIKQGNTYGYINPKGQFVIKPTYKDAWGFVDGLAKVQVNGKYGFINKTGKFTIKPTDALTNSGHAFFEGLLPVSSQGKWGFWDKTGVVKIPHTYDFASYFSEGRAVVGKRHGDTLLYGHIDKQGKITTPIKYTYVSDFLDGVAMVVESDKIFYINPKGDITDHTVMP